MAEPFSRLRQLRGIVYLSAGVLFCVECIPHVVPTLTRRRCVCPAHLMIMMGCSLIHSCEAPGDDPPEELRRHVHRIAAAMVSCE